MYLKWNEKHDNVCKIEQSCLIVKEADGEGNEAEDADRERHDQAEPSRSNKGYPLLHSCPSHESGSGMFQGWVPVPL